MRWPRGKDLPAPLLLLAFEGCTVTYVNSLFTNSSRWLILGLVWVLLLRDPTFKALLKTRVATLNLLFAGWVLATYFWSELPALSAMKGLAFLLVSLAGMGAGYAWVRHHPLEKALDGLAALALIVLMAGLLGRDAIQNPDEYHGLTLYQGLTGNSNMFGCLAAMAFPYAAWQYHRQPGSRGWLVLTLTFVAFALLSNSRASIATVLISGLGLFGAMGARKILPWVSGVVVSLLLMSVAMPETLQDLETRFIYKGERSGVTQSRDEVWEISYEQALKGGLIGGGYGVTIGSLEGFDGSLSSMGYGREKGNSQLGIMEETGVIGLAFYLTATLSLFRLVWRARSNSRSAPFKPLLGLVSGVLAGFTFQSIFEAWYNAPGSPESMYYWVMAGIAIGLATDVRLDPASRWARGAALALNRPAARETARGNSSMHTGSIKPRS